MKYSDSGNAILPNTFQHPNIFVDRLMYYLTPEENVVLTFAIRRILGFQENISTRKDNISLSQFVDGIKAKDGHVVSLGCGLGATSVRTALNALEKYRILLPTTEKADAKKGQEYWLQSSDTNIDWDGLEARSTQKKEKSIHRTVKARCSVRQNTSGCSVGQNPKVLSDNTLGFCGTETQNPQKPTETHPAPKKDFVDGMVELSQSSGMQKVNIKLHIASRIKVRLNLNPSGKDAETFIEYAAQCKIKDGWDIEKFLDWWLIEENGGKRAFWSFKRMEQQYPGAFPSETSKSEPTVMFVPESEAPAQPEPQPVYTPHPRLKAKNLAAFQRLEALG